MKFLLAILIASQAIILLDAQQQAREQTVGVVGRDSIVRYTQIVSGGPTRAYTIDIGRPITGVRTFDLTPGGTSTWGLTEGAINTNRMVFNISASAPGNPFELRITAFSSSTLVHASAMFMTLVMMFAHFVR